MSEVKHLTTIVMEGGFNVDVELPAHEVVTSFRECNNGKNIDAGAWWTPWSNCTVRLDRVLAICPGKPRKQSS